MTTTGGTGTAAGADPFAEVLGQDEAIEQLRAAVGRTVHAYLLVGPPGAGKRRAALALAGELLAAGALGSGDTVGVERHRRLARAEAHPDLTVVEREGPFITRDQAREIVVRSVRSPLEATCQVLVLTEFHLVVDAAPVLLKAIEEPPPATIFLILADEITPELVTIASRCVVIRFRALDPAVVELLRSLRPGDRVKFVQTVRVGGRKWEAVAEGAFNGVAYLETGITLPPNGYDMLRDEFDAILLGALGDPRVSDKDRKSTRLNYSH